MTLGTHVAFASVLYLGGATLFGYKPDWIGWLLAVVASLLPVAAWLIEGELLRVVAERVAMAGHTLRWLVSRINQGRPYYLLGEVEMPAAKGPALAGQLDGVETYNPASYRRRDSPPVLRPRPGAGAVAGPHRDEGRSGGAVLAQAW